MLILLATSGIYAGCAGGGKPDAVATAKPGAAGAANQETRYRVTKDTTPFYKYGPQQPGGPDLSLKKGTDVLMVKRAFGYSQVKTTDTLQTGYVSTEDVAPLTAQELAALIPATPSSPVQSVGGAGKRSRAIVGQYTLPPGAGAQDRLPEPEATPTPPPNNMFRY